MDGLKGLRPEDRITRPERRRSWTFSGGLLALVVITIAGVVGFGQGSALIKELGLWQAKPVDMPELGLHAIPPEIAGSPSVSSLLSRLQREPCDQEAILPLAEGFKNLGRQRYAAEALSSFYARCKGSEQLLDDAVEIYMGLGDFERAYALGDTLVKADPAYGRFRYLRGWAAEKLGRHQQSLIDYTNALNLLGNPANVAGSEFYNVAQAHARLGQFCEAITPIQQWMSYDYRRDTPQTRTIIREFAEKGRCDSTYAIADETFTLPAKGDVVTATVIVNGKKGVFVIDTGASLVSMTAAFADQAGLARDPRNEIVSFTANGPAAAFLSRADTVSLGPIAARNVTVSISEPGRDFGPGIDGLLGMSFLARFHLKMTPDRIEISSSR